MKKIYQLNVQFGKINTDLYFEDKETAESTAAILYGSVKENSIDQLEIIATFHEVLSKEKVAEYVRTGLWLSQFSGKN